MGILTLENAQLVFMDTPGIHKPQHKLGEFMNDVALQSIPDADVILWLVDVSVSPHPEDLIIADKLNTNPPPGWVVLVLNKVDLLPKEKLLPMITKYTGFRDFSAVVPLSALTGDNTDRLLAVIKEALPEGPQYYPEDEVTDQPERVVAAELIREKIFRLTREEIPHSSVVEVEEMKTRSNGDVFVRATIYVERDSQKGIIIGAVAPCSKK